MEELKNDGHGEVQVAFSFGVMSALSPDLIPDFRAAYPKIDLKISEYPDDECQNAIFGIPGHEKFALNRGTVQRFYVTQKVLEEGMVVKWLTSRPVKNGTKRNMFAVVKRFAKYLSSLGFSVKIPEAPRSVTDYVPYIFSDEEFGRIIYAADNFHGSVRINKSSILFPILLRLLYGCGLRLGEGLGLTWSDVDLENGVITIRAAKNMKQRFVPMSSSMNVLLKEYYEMVRRKGICSDYLFETDARYGTGKPYKNVTFEQWFAKILCAAEINFTRSTPHERGPCPHCLRHLFVFDSLHKSESEGRAFDETAPSLSAYLGHENLFSLEKYLNKDYSLYRHSHQRVNEFIKDVFPEVSFL